jgi:hypothetical protein
MNRGRVPAVEDVDPGAIVGSPHIFTLAMARIRMLGRAGDLLLRGIPVPPDMARDAAVSAKQFPAIGPIESTPRHDAGDAPRNVCIGSGGRVPSRAETTRRSDAISAKQFPTKIATGSGPLDMAGVVVCARGIESRSTVMAGLVADKPSHDSPMAHFAAFFAASSAARSAARAPPRMPAIAWLPS